MRRGLIAAALLLAACGPETRIELVTIEAASAQLELCGRPSVPMRKTSTGFELRLSADCRGAGRVVLTYADGAIVTCPVKIVVAGMPAWYRFEVANRTCRVA